MQPTFKLIKKLVFSLFLTICILPAVQSQFYSTGQDPWCIKWKQINTSNFRLVYDSTFENDAQRIAAILDYSCRYSKKSLNPNKIKIPIIIHNYSVISNGMVAWAPKHMELYPVSPQDVNSQYWYSQLGIHEMRHVYQINTLNTGFTKVFSLFYGEMWTGLTSAFAHQWMMEGDAVIAETALSQSGRGREPSFEMGYRAISLNNKEIPYKKAIFGSFKDYVPDHYQSGYLMTSYGRITYGTDLWKKYLEFIGKYPFTLFPSYFALKEYTGEGRKALFNSSLSYYKQNWIKEKLSLKLTPVDSVTVIKTKDYTSYRYSIALDSLHIISLKTSMDDNAKIVKINKKNGQEQVLVNIGTSFNDNLSFSNNTIVWAEYKSDIRWHHKNYNEIYTFDVNSGKVKRLTRKTRYFSPNISPDGTKIAAIETSVTGQNSIVLISAKDGKILASVQSPAYTDLQTPSWNSRSQKLIMTAVSNEGKYLLLLNTENNVIVNITKPSEHNISQPCFLNDSTIIYRSSTSGVENLYSLSLTSAEVKQITSSLYGAFDPNVSYAQLTWSEYTANGYKPAIRNVQDLTPFSAQKRYTNFFAVADSLSKQEKFNPFTDSIEIKHYKSKRYYPLGHLINIHSWWPYYSNIKSENTGKNTTEMGLTVMSQNLLNTLTLVASAKTGDGLSTQSLTMTYSGFYPIIQLTFSNNENPNNTITHKTNVAGRILQPLNFSRHNYITAVVPYVGYEYEQYKENHKTTQKNTYYKLGIELTNYKRMSLRDILPRFGQKIKINTDVANDDNYNPNWFGYGIIYLPGILNHQSIQLTYSVERQKIFSSNYLKLSRGYEIKYFNDLNKLSVDYITPLIYPDMPLLGVFYFKRVKANIFWDYSIVTYNSQNQNIKQSSYGYEINTDFYLFHIPYSLNIGVRGSFNNVKKQWVYEITTEIPFESMF